MIMRTFKTNYNRKVARKRYEKDAEQIKELKQKRYK